ncbi:major outer membrane protein [Campylobacterota bacterium DY0563]|uniref:major outer membrane protein n=1 Tax=Halarcobacter sp. TaxID=2321133 RepID=UPI0029F4604F|nr:major outer membrane protein [Halarcobacter sp.]
MKKFAKMSLVAALAVAGTTASAQPLTEAIKNVDVSGSVVYRYNDYNDDYSSTNSNFSQSTNNYKIGLTAKAKVNDDVTAVTRFLVTADADNGLTSLDTQNGGDGQVSVVLSNVYFSYTGLANTTINVGKQGLGTPWTVAIDADSEEQTGTGILALTNVGPVTLAGGYFNQTNLAASSKAKINGAVSVGGLLDSSDDIYTLAAIANIGPVAIDAWYLDMDNTFDTFTIGAKAKFDLDAVNLGIEGRYTSLDLDDLLDPADTDNALYKLVLTAKAGIFNAKLAYIATDEEGGLVALDNDAKTAYQTWNMNANGYADADMYNVVFGVQALPSLHISANYSNMEYGAGDAEQEELYAQFVYKMSKNFSTYVRYGKYTADNAAGIETTDDMRGRLQVQYSF